MMPEGNCPRCGSPQLTHELSPDEIERFAEVAFDAMTRFGGFIGLPKLDARCLDCGHIWTPKPVETPSAAETFDEPERESDEYDIPPQKRCRLYSRGHTPHFIQVRKSEEDLEHRGQQGIVVDISAVETAFSVEVDGIIRRYRNHDTGRLADMLETLGDQVVVDESWGLLRIPDGFAAYCFSIANADEPLRPCV